MHIYLIGYRGSGKSTVGRLLAQALDRPLVDTDDWIESGQEKTIREIFAERGEAGFRDLEQTAVSQVASFPDPTVVNWEVELSFALPIGKHCKPLVAVFGWTHRPSFFTRSRFVRILAVVIVVRI